MAAHELHHGKPNPIMFYIRIYRVIQGCRTNHRRRLTDGDFSGVQYDNNTWGLTGQASPSVDDLAQENKTAPPRRRLLQTFLFFRGVPRKNPPTRSHFFSLPHGNWTLDAATNGTSGSSAAPTTPTRAPHPTADRSPEEAGLPLQHQADFSFSISTIVTLTVTAHSTSRVTVHTKVQPMTSGSSKLGGRAEAPSCITPWFRIVLKLIEAFPMASDGTLGWHHEPPSFTAPPRQPLLHYTPWQHMNSTTASRIR